MSSIVAKEPKTVPPRIAVVMVGDETSGAMEATCLLIEQVGREVDVEVVVFCDGALTERVRKLPVTLHQLGRNRPAIIRLASKWGRFRRAAAKAFNIGWVIERSIRLAILLVRTRRHVVHTGAGYAALATMLAGFVHRIVCICHWRAVGHDIMGMGAFGWLIRRRVSRILAISDAVRASLPPDWSRFTQIVFDAIDVGEVSRRAQDRRGELRKTIAIDAKAPLVAQVGVYAPHKGQHFTIQAVASIADRFTNVQAALFGYVANPLSADYLEEIQQLARSMGVADCCHFLCDVPSPGDLFGDADVAVVPTWGKGEGFGLVTVEAMACGIPVVAFDAGAASELIVDGETGLLVPDQDADAFASAIGELLADKNRARQMGIAGRKRAFELFDVSRLRRELVAVYWEMAAFPNAR